MKKKVMLEWVKALRSGKYKQTVGTLRNDEGFCCLGVLCDLHGKATKRRVAKRFEGFDRLGHVPDEEVVAWAGLSSYNPTVSDDVESLAEMNDIKGCSFAEIADVIEARYKDL